jgi:hypothetical protein
MFDLIVASAFYSQVEEDSTTISSISVKENDCVRVLVGDNITIQEQQKKVRFAIEEESIPDNAVEIISIPSQDISSVDLSIPSKEPPLSLYVVEEPLAADESYTTVAAPLSIQEQLDAMPWKHKFAIKACYALLFSTPFIPIMSIILHLMLLYTPTQPTLVSCRPHIFPKA